MAMIKTLVVKDADGNSTSISTAVGAASVTDKGNLEITSDKSINIEPNKHVKIKPGSGGQIELLPDHTGDLSEVLVKAQVSVNEQGANLASEVPVRLKVNSTELELNTKGAPDTNSYDMKFKTGVKDSQSGEHYCQTKLKGRSFDIRCYEHGGIALQVAGKDSDGHENKIKFESDRTTLPNATGTYNGEGGKGVEFGTFNNLHTSLYTGDYRFKSDAPIYPSTRGAIANDASTGKSDYPTQADDFKDILPTNSGTVTWADIYAVVAYIKATKSSEIASYYPKFT